MGALAIAPMTAFAAPKPGKAEPPKTEAPKGGPEKGPHKESMSDGQAVGILALLGIGGLIAGGVFLAKRRGGGAKGDGRPYEAILPQRKHDWELLLSPEQADAMFRGITAYRDSGHDCYLNHDDALITFYEPRLFVSLHRLTNDFLAAGQAAVADPISSVRAILDGYVASESPGVLHLSKDWYSTPVDGLDFKKFSDVCYDALTKPIVYIEGTQGSSADENSGSMTLKIEAGGPLNTFCVDVRRVLPAVIEARRARPNEPLIDVVRPVVNAMARGELRGGMWTRGQATPTELDILRRVTSTSAQAAA